MLDFEDVDTEIPSRLWGKGRLYPGSVKQDKVAEEAAREMLVLHISLLAPGASPADFRLVANVSYRGIRSVGFTQTYKGMEVVGKDPLLPGMSFSSGSPSQFFVRVSKRILFSKVGHEGALPT